MALPQVKLDICQLLIENKFFVDSDTAQTKQKMQLKSALCLRLLLFFDSLHDFMDSARMLTAFSQIKNNTDNVYGNFFNEQLPPDHPLRAEFNPLFQKAQQAMSKNNPKDALKPNAQLGEWMYRKLVGNSKDSEIMSRIALHLFIKLLRDLNDMLQKLAADEPLGTNLYILKELVNKMNFFTTSPQQMNFLKINSIFYNTMAGNKTELKNGFKEAANDVKNTPILTNLSKQPDNPFGTNLKNHFFLYNDNNCPGEGCVAPVGTTPQAQIYLYPSILLYTDVYAQEFGIKPNASSYLKGLKNIIEGSDDDSSSKGFFTTDGKPRGKSTLKEPALDLMQFIKNHEPENDVTNFPIYIIVILLYLWDRKDIPVSSDKKNDVHLFYFKYILEFALNCYEFKPKLEFVDIQDKQVKSISYINLIIKYLCHQDLSLLPEPPYTPIASPEEPDSCINRLSTFSSQQLQSQLALNFNNFFQKEVDLVIDADGKPRSINYLTSYFMQLFTTLTSAPNAPEYQKCTIFKTLGSYFDASTTSNTESLLAKIVSKTAEELENDEIEQTIESKVESYVYPCQFIITAGGYILMDLIFTYQSVVDKDGKAGYQPFIQFIKFFSDETPTENLPGGRDGSVSCAIFKFLLELKRPGGPVSIKHLLVKSMGDFSQMLFYYSLRLWRKNIGKNTVGIYHTLDTWAAGLASLFVNGVICEQGMDDLKLDKESIYKLASNKIYISKKLKNDMDSYSSNWAVDLNLLKPYLESKEFKTQLLSLASLEELKNTLLQNLSTQQAKLVQMVINNPTIADRLLELIKNQTNKVPALEAELKDTLQIAEENKSLLDDPTLPAAAAQTIKLTVHLLNNTTLPAIQEKLTEARKWDKVFAQELEEAYVEEIKSSKTLHDVAESEDADEQKGGVKYNLRSKGKLYPNIFKPIAEEIEDDKELGEIEDPIQTTEKITTIAENVRAMLFEIHQIKDQIKTYFLQLDTTHIQIGEDPTQTTTPSVLTSSLESIIDQCNITTNPGCPTLVNFIEKLLRFMPKNLIQTFENNLNVDEEIKEVNEIITENQGMVLRSGKILPGLKEPKASSEPKESLKSGIDKSAARSARAKKALGRQTAQGRKRLKRGGKLTVKANKKKLFKKTKKKGKFRKYYKTRKHYKNKNAKNIEKIFKNLKI